MALSKVDLANQVENQLPQNLVANNLPFRNIIINGDMSIAQRSTSVASITSTSYYTVDRWIMNIGTSGTWTMSQDTDVPSGQGFATSLKLDCTTANASLSASSNFSFQQRFEGQNLQYLKKGTVNAESLTLSFWVKSNKTGTYIVEIREGNLSRSISKSYTIDSASTWEKKTITFAGDTTGILANDNTNALVLAMWLSAGTNFTSGTLNTSWNTRVAANVAVGQVNLADNTANEWYITGVQLEAGTTASDFEFLPYDVNLGRCMRYYQNLDLGQLGFGFATANGQWMYINVGLSTVMRANPTATQGSISASGSTNTIGVSLTRPQQFVYQLQASGSGSDIYALGTSAQITLSAEL